VPNVASVSELSILTAPSVFSSDYIERIHNRNTMHVKKEFAICHLNSHFGLCIFQVITVCSHRYATANVYPFYIIARKNRRSSQNWQFRDTGNIGHTRHSTKTIKKNTTQKTKKMNNMNLT